MSLFTVRNYLLQGFHESHKMFWHANKFDLRYIYLQFSISTVYLLTVLYIYSISTYSSLYLQYIYLQFSLLALGGPSAPRFLWWCSDCCSGGRQVPPSTAQKSPSYTKSNISILIWCLYKVLELTGDLRGQWEGVRSGYRPFWLPAMRLLLVPLF